MTYLFFVCAIVSVIQPIFCLIQAPPTWVTSSYFKAGSNSIINGTSTTGSSTTPTPTATLTFPSAFPSIPNLAYGMSHYQSDDNLGQQMFEVNRTGLTTTSFSVKVQISGNTDIWIVVVRYIGVSKAFPHHLNSFDNVPINYGAGTLTAFNTRSTPLITYTNSINYTTQATLIASNYTTFIAPFTNIKILLFMTSMFFDGSGSQTSTTFYPPKIRTSATVTSVDHYSITVVFGTQATCSRIHYSMIIFDQADVQASGQYLLYCLRIDMTAAGGDVALPFQLISNAIMGFTDFQSFRTETLIKFYLNFANLTNGSYGIHMPVSVPRNAAKTSISTYGFTLFYLKSWTCPNLTYYNQTLNLCTECLIPFCASCLNQTACHTCQTGYMLNSSSCIPIPCSVPNCFTCINSSYCMQCDSTYYVVSGSCVLCDSLTNDFFDVNQTCQHCSLSQCLNCSSLTSCFHCNQTNSYFLNITDNHCYQCSINQCTTCLNLTACQACNTTNSYFIDLNDNLCYPCNLTGCQTCSNLTACQTCNTTNNYFIDLTDSLCYPCNLTGCQTCTNLTACQNCSVGYSLDLSSSLCYVCSLAECLTCLNSSACQTCNTTNNYFIDLTDSLCYPCNLTGCQTCTNLTACQNCSVGYSLDLSSSLCYVCSLTECLTCFNSTACQICNTTNNYFADLNDNLCYPCNLTGCQTCTNLTACQTCNTTNNYFIDPTDSLCYPCNLTGCQTCTNLTACQNCSVGYSLDVTSSLCFVCSLTECLACVNSTACQTCNQTHNYFLDPSDNLCYACNLTGCQTCQNLTACQTCSSGYSLDTSSLCFVCSLPGCINCSSSTTCYDCSQTNNYVLLLNATCQLCTLSLGYFPNVNTSQCQLCSIVGCSTCSSLIQCSICDTNNSYYILSNNLCGYCNSSIDQYINPTSNNTCQQCQITQCLNCSSLSTCQQCNTTASYFLNFTDNICYPCSISNCLQCNNLTSCLICDQFNQYFINSNGLCQRCSLFGCLNCSSLYSCYQCDLNNSIGFDLSYNNSNNDSICGTCNVSCICDGYYLPYNTILQQCTSYCGDGIIVLSQNCDDNNTNSTDGCSSLCQIQINYTCTGQPSNCTYTPPQSIQTQPTILLPTQQCQIKKQQGCNKLYIKIPKYRIPAGWSNIQSCNIKNKGINKLNIQQKQQQIIIHATNQRDLINQTISIQINGQIINIQYISQKQSFIPILYYTQQQCTSHQSTKQLLLGVKITSYATLIMSLFSCKIVGLELFGALQLSYFTIASHNFINVYLSPMLKLKQLNGLNMKLFQQNHNNLPNSQQQMGLASVFLNNCNIMLAVFFAELFISGVLCIIAKIIGNQKLYDVSIKLLKQGFVTMVMFNSFNFAFSAGTHIKYANKQDKMYLPSTIALAMTMLAMLICTIAMQFTQKNAYGQFKNKFKENWICKLFIPLSICYRMSLGLYIAFKNDYQQSTLIILGIVIIYILYFITNLPYTDTYQNYRSGIINLTMTVTLFTTNYYRSMKSTTALQIKSRINQPALVQLVLIVVSTFVSAVVVIYETYQAIKQCKSKKNRVRRVSEVTRTEESQLNFH